MLRGLHTFTSVICLTIVFAFQAGVSQWTGHTAQAQIQVDYPYNHRRFDGRAFHLCHVI